MIKVKLKSKDHYINCTFQNQHHPLEGFSRVDKNLQFDWNHMYLLSRVVRWRLGFNWDASMRLESCAFRKLLSVAELVGRPLGCS